MFSMYLVLLLISVAAVAPSWAILFPLEEDGAQEHDGHMLDLITEAERFESKRVMWHPPPPPPQTLQDNAPHAKVEHEEEEEEEGESEAPKLLSVSPPSEEYSVLPLLLSDEDLDLLLGVAGSSQVETRVKPPPGFRIPTRAEMLRRSRYASVDEDDENDRARIGRPDYSPFSKRVRQKITKKRVKPKKKLDKLRTKSKEKSDKLRKVLRKRPEDKEESSQRGQEKADSKDSKVTTSVTKSVVRVVSSSARPPRAEDIKVPLDSLPLPSSTPHLDVLQLGDEQILANFLLSDSDLSKSMQRSLSPSYFQQFDLGAELWTPETKSGHPAEDVDRRAALSNARESVKARRRQESSSAERKVKQLLVSDPYDDIEEAKIDTGDKSRIAAARSYEPTLIPAPLPPSSNVVLPRSRPYKELLSTAVTTPRPRSRPSPSPFLKDSEFPDFRDIELQFGNFGHFNEEAPWGGHSADFFGRNNDKDARVPVDPLLHDAPHHSLRNEPPPHSQKLHAVPHHRVVGQAAPPFRGLHDKPRHPLVKEGDLLVQGLHDKLRHPPQNAVDTHIVPGGLHDKPFHALKSPSRTVQTPPPKSHSSSVPAEGAPFQSLPTATSTAFGAKLFASNFPSFPFDEARNIEPIRPVIFEDLVSNVIRRKDKFVGSGSGDDFLVDHDDINSFSPSQRDSRTIPAPPPPPKPKESNTKGFVATPPFYGANDLLGYDNVAVASFDQLSAPRAAKPRKDNDDTGNLKFTADDIVEAQERSDDGSDRKVSVENRRSHAGHVLQDSYGVPHGPVVTQGLHDHPVLHEVAPHDRSLHEKPLHPILNEVIPGHQDIPHHQHGPQVHQERQLYAEEVKELKRPLFVPPPTGEVEQVYYDDPLHTPVYIEKKKPKKTISSHPSKQATATVSFSFGKLKSPFKEEKIHLAKKNPRLNKSLFVPPPTMIPIVGTMGPVNHVTSSKPEVFHYDISESHHAPQHAIPKEAAHHNPILHDKPIHRVEPHDLHDKPQHALLNDVLQLDPLLHDVPHHSLQNELPPHLQELHAVPHHRVVSEATPPFPGLHDKPRHPLVEEGDHLVQRHHHKLHHPLQNAVEPHIVPGGPHDQPFHAVKPHIPSLVEPFVKSLRDGPLHPVLSEMESHIQGIQDRPDHAINEVVYVPELSVDIHHPLISKVEAVVPHGSRVHDKPQHPLGLHDKPKHPLSLHDKPKHPLSLHEKPQHPLGLHEKPQHPLSLHEKPQHPLSLHEKPQHPLGLHDKPQHPQGLHDKPQHTQGLHDKPQHQVFKETLPFGFRLHYDPRVIEEVIHNRPQHPGIPEVLPHLGGIHDEPQHPQFKLPQPHGQDLHDGPLHPLVHEAVPPPPELHDKPRHPLLKEGDQLVQNHHDKLHHPVQNGAEPHIGPGLHDKPIHSLGLERDIFSEMPRGSPYFAPHQQEAVRVPKITGHGFPDVIRHVSSYSRDLPFPESHREPRLVDYGAATGGDGSFGWYSDHPVSIGQIIDNGVQKW